MSWLIEILFLVFLNIVTLSVMFFTFEALKDLFIFPEADEIRAELLILVSKIRLRSF